MNLNQAESHFKQQQQLLGNLADETSFNMIYSLIEQNRQLREQVDRLTILNRHYYNKFYNGDIDKMIQDFQYLMGD